MKQGYLRDYFSAFAFKRLADVEVNPEKSNEHEFNGVSAFKDILGSERRTIRAHIVYLADKEDSILEDDVCLTWYDSRENHPTRSEYRLYYQTSRCIDAAEAGDLMIVALNQSNQLNIFIARAGDTIENQLTWLFAIDIDRNLFNSFELREIPKADRSNFFTEIILEKIGVDTSADEPELLNKLIKKFGRKFPSTKEFSAFAREECEPVDVNNFPDRAISKWLYTEERAFKTLERFLVERRLEKTFRDVDDFIKFSLSIHGRRKSRAGFALENHLCHLFSCMGIHYSYNKITENKVRPDFIFPGIEHYHNLKFSAQLLTALGVKTTCKDRWRQVLSEATRIPKKHLLTMEPAISSNQTREMMENNLQLVIPDEIRASYSPAQQEWLISVKDFTDLVKFRQKKI